MKQNQTVTLFPNDYVFLDQDGNMVTWASSDQIFITADTYEIESEEEYTPVRCTDLPADKQEVLIDNIAKYKS